MVKNIQKSKKILVICPHPEGIVPGQRLKYEQYFEHWRAEGFEVDVRPFMSVKLQSVLYKKGFYWTKISEVIKGYAKRIQLLFNVKDYDLVYYFLWVTPFGFPFFERLYINASKGKIFDIDDLVFLESKSTKSWLIKKLKGYQKPVFLMKHVDHVITCTPFLDQFVRKHNQNTTDISSTINTDKYKPKQDYNFQKSKPIIGWSGSHSTVAHLKTLFPALKILKSKVDFKLVVMGTNEKLAFDGLEIESLPWQESYEVDVISSFDIGVYPLPNEQWVLGKSSLKALQYMSLGIPTVATAIGTNFRVIEDGISGFLVNNDDEWVKHLHLLLTDVSLREKIGKNAAEVVEQKFSINANKKAYLDILNQVVEKSNA
jgi:L-malate glycosyltransferase